MCRDIIDSCRKFDFVATPLRHFAVFPQTSNAKQAINWTEFNAGWNLQTGNLCHPSDGEFVRSESATVDNIELFT